MIQIQLQRGKKVLKMFLGLIVAQVSKSDAYFYRAVARKD